MIGQQSNTESSGVEVSSKTETFTSRKYGAIKILLPQADDDFYFYGQVSMVVDIMSANSEINTTFLLKGSVHVWNKRWYRATATNLTDDSSEKLNTRFYTDTENQNRIAILLGDYNSSWYGMSCTIRELTWDKKDLVESYAEYFKLEDFEISLKNNNNYINNSITIQANDSLISGKDFQPDISKLNQDVFSLQQSNSNPTYALDPTTKPLIVWNSSTQKFEYQNNMVSMKNYDDNSTPLYNDKAYRISERILGDIVNISGWFDLGNYKNNINPNLVDQYGLPIHFVSNGGLIKIPIVFSQSLGYRFHMMCMCTDSFTEATKSNVRQHLIDTWRSTGQFQLVGDAMYIKVGDATVNKRWWFDFDINLRLR